MLSCYKSFTEKDWADGKAIIGTQWRRANFCIANT